MQDLVYEQNLTVKQWLAMEKLLDDKIKFLLFGGGRGGGKSYLGWEWVVMMCLRYPGIRVFVARNELKRFMNSTYPTFLKVLKDHKLPPEIWSLNSQYNYIRWSNNSRIDILDVAYQPRDPMYERLGSTEYTIGWLEEIGEIKEKAFDMLKSSVGRQLNKEYGIKPKIFMTCNPKKHWAYHQFYKPWREDKLPEDSCFIQSLYGDNPHTAKEYGEMLNTITDPVMRERLRDGIWEYSDDESSLIDYERILDIFTIEPEFVSDDIQCLTSDVARFGRDKAVIMIWQGWHIKKLWYYNKSSTKFLREKIEKILQQFHIPNYYAVIDDGGLGSGVTDYILGCNRFVAGSRPVEALDENPSEIERYSFLNLRSQCYHTLAEAINKGMVSIDMDGIMIPEDDQKKGITQYDVRNWIVQELEVIRKKNHEKNENKFGIIPKDEMKDVIQRSPDFADCLSQRSVLSFGTDAVVGDMGRYEVDVVW